MSTARFVTVAVVLGSALCSAGCSGPPEDALGDRRRRGSGRAPRGRCGRQARRDALGVEGSRRRSRRRASWSMRAGRSRFPTIGALARSAELPWTRTTTSGSITGRGRWTRARPARCRETATNDARRADQRARPSKALRRTQHGLLCPGAVRAQVRPRREPAHGMGRTLRSGLPRRVTAARRTAVSGRRVSTASSWTTTTSCTSSGNGEDGGSRQQQGVGDVSVGTVVTATTRTY